MTARRTLFLAALLAVVSVSARGQILNITPTSLPVFPVGQAIPSQQLSTQFPNDPTIWSVSVGTLPPNLILGNATGIISGTPTLAGAFTFTVSATDVSNNFTGAQQYTIYVSTGSPLTLTPLTPAPPGGAVGSNYASFTFQVSGGVPGYTWALQGGTNADGLTLNASTGLLSGIPQAGGVFPIGITVTDASGAPVSASFNLNVLGIATPSLPAGAIVVPYLQILRSVGATGPVVWSLFGTNALPPGLNLSAQGLIAGTPTVVGTYPFQVNVTDTAAKLTAIQSFSISIASVLTVTTASLPNGTVGVNYTALLQALGGTAPYSWNVTGLPAGLALDSKTGVLSGAPTAGGTSTISVTVTDAANGTATASLSLTVGALTISPATLPNGVVGVPYPATTLTVAGATVTSWAVSLGTLPAGLILNASTGVISGTPTAAGSSPFIIAASFANLTAVVPPVRQSFTLVINAPPLATISGLPATGAAGTQPAASVSLGGGTYPLNIAGTMTLTFAPASGGSQLYDAKFASGPPTTATFTIPAGASQGSFSTTPFTSAPVMVGTVAGNITIVTTLQDSAGNPLPQPAPAIINVIPTVPVITKVTIGAVTSSGFSISATGYSTPRDMTSALFHFTSPTNTQLASADVTVPLTSAFTSWYGSAASNAFGSQFTMTVQFTFSGSPGTTVPFTAVTLTLTNSKGSSSVFGPVNP